MSASAKSLEKNLQFAFDSPDFATIVLPETEATWEAFKNVADTPETRPGDQNEARNTGADGAESPDSKGSNGQDGSAPVAADLLQKRVQELEAQLKDQKDKYLYLYADFDNFKKRSIKERSDLMKFGWENVARDMVQVMDNFERAMAHIPATTDKNLSEGLKMILAQMRSTLQKQGVQQIETLGKEFNPELEEAVGQMPSDKPAGTVVKEELPGYTLHGRLLRAANVIVSMGQATG